MVPSNSQDCAVAPPPDNQSVRKSTPVGAEFPCCVAPLLQVPAALLPRWPSGCALVDCRQLLLLVSWQRAIIRLWLLFCCCVRLLLHGDCDHSVLPTPGMLAEFGAERTIPVWRLLQETLSSRVGGLLFWTLWILQPRAIIFVDQVFSVLLRCHLSLLVFSFLWFMVAVRCGAAVCCVMLYCLPVAVEGEAIVSLATRVVEGCRGRKGGRCVGW